MVDRIVLDGTEDELAGIPSILAELVRGNLEQRPRLARVLDRLDGTIAITVGEGDEAASATVVFGNGRMTVRSGADPQAKIRVHGTFDAILGLSRVPMLGPYPNVFRAAARRFLRDVRSGNVRITGFKQAPDLLGGLMRLVSVG